MSYPVTIEASIFLKVLLSFVCGESVHIHCVRVILVTSGESRGVCLLCLSLESNDSSFPVNYFLESPMLGVEFRGRLVPVVDRGWKRVLRKNLPVLIPSMKYSISILSSVSFVHPARILNCATYSSAVSFVCLRCLNWARASPSASAAENAFLSVAKNLVKVP